MKTRRDVLCNFLRYADETADRVRNGIELYRKGYAYFNIKDKDGSPVPGVKISVKQKKHDFKYGANIFMLGELESDEKNDSYRSLFKSACNMATLPFYWKDIEPTRGMTRYAADSPRIYRRPSPDLCMDYCLKNGIEPREHGLAYERMFPDWLKNAGVREIKYALERRFAETAERYADKIPTVEVTNEMMWINGTTAFYHEPDYITWCFKLAEKYFPGNELSINEQPAVWKSPSKASADYYLMIENALLKGARIDAVGMQFHMFHKPEDELEATDRYYNPKCLYDILDTYYDGLRLPVQITEITVPAYSSESGDEELQAEIIKRLYSIWFSHPAVEQIIYWNLVDGYAYGATPGDMTTGENKYFGGLLRFDMSEKPAFKAVKDLFGKEWRTECETGSDADGSACFKGFYGEYDVIVIHGDKRVSRSVRLSKKNKNEYEIII